MFEPEESDADLYRPPASRRSRRGEGGGKGGAVEAAAATAAAGALMQASIEGPAEAIRGALGGGDIVVAAAANDIPEDPDKSFSFRLPKKGRFGPSAKIRAIKNALYRISVRKNH